MIRMALFSALCMFAVSALASVTLGGELSYPALPPALPVYDTVFDPTMAARVTSKVGPGVEAAKGEVSYFSSAPLPAVVPLFDSVAQRAAVTAFFTAVLPADFTPRRLGRRLTLVRQEFHRDGSTPGPETKGMFFRFERFIRIGPREYPVLGDGSFAVMEVVATNARSVILRWNKALEPNDVTSVPLTPCRLLSELMARFPPRYDVSVTESPEIVYYDDGSRIRPVYRVEVVVNRHDSGHIDHETLFLSAVALPPVVVAGANPIACNAMAQVALDTSVDRYADNADGGWTTNAQRFRAALPDPPFRDRAFCTIASNVLATGASYIDGSNAALLEVHGEPGCVFVGTTCHALSDAGGYGATDDGLQLLMLHSCEIVTTSEDSDSEWANRWWTIFKGLHTVLGYRSEMNIEDGVSVAMARRLERDNPMIESWLAEAAGASIYGQSSPNGLPAAVTVCDGDGKKPSELKQVKTFDCLVMYWLKN